MNLLALESSLQPYDAEDCDPFSAPPNAWYAEISNNHGG